MTTNLFGMGELDMFQDFIHLFFPYIIC